MSTLSNETRDLIRAVADRIESEKSPGFDQGAWGAQVRTGVFDCDTPTCLAGHTLVELAFRGLTIPVGESLLERSRFKDERIRFAAHMLDLPDVEELDKPVGCPEMFTSQPSPFGKKPDDHEMAAHLRKVAERGYW